MSHSAPIVCLTGPTASGKTDISLALAARLPLEIISIDSAMVYKGFDIGAGKPSRDILTAVPHHLIDVCTPDQPFSAHDFVVQATQCIHDIQARGHIPLLVGGTMLYLKALIEGLSDLPSSDPAVRAHLQGYIQTHSLAALHDKLRVCDPLSAARIHSTDTQRIMRAMEVYMCTGKPLSVFHQQKKPSPFHFTVFSTYTEDRADLHHRIEQRFDHMLNTGFIDEVEGLIRAFSMDAHTPAMRAVGYRQVWGYLKGEYDRARMREKAIVATRQLAKRQFTWIRHWKNLQRTPMDILQSANCLMPALSAHYKV